MKVPDRRRLGDADGLVEDLGEPEVEHLHAPCGPTRCRQEEVPRLDVAVHDALLVRVVERQRPGLEERHHLLERSPAELLVAASLQVGGERKTVQPFEHHVRHSAPLAGATVVPLMMQRTMSRLPCPRR